MNDLWPLQQAIYAALTGPSPDLYPVYDAVPRTATMPYIVIGPVTALQDEEITEESTDATVEIHGWSKVAGKVQAHAILEYVRDLLHNQDIDDEGEEIWAAFEEFRTILEDPKSTADSRLYHAVARYRFRTN